MSIEYRNISKIFFIFTKALCSKIRIFSVLFNKYLKFADKRFMEVLTGITIDGIAHELNIPWKTAHKRLEQLGIEPLTRKALYDLSVVDKIREIPRKGSPKKNIELILGNPMKEKVNLFFNCAKAVLKGYLIARKKFNIRLNVLSAVETPSKSTNKEYTKIAETFKKLFKKQGNGNLPLKEILQFLKNAASDNGEDELLNMIEEIESSL